MRFIPAIIIYIAALWLIVRFVAIGPGGTSEAVHRCHTRPIGIASVWDGLGEIHGRLGRNQSPVRIRAMQPQQAQDELCMPQRRTVNSGYAASRLRRNNR